MRLDQKIDSNVIKEALKIDVDIATQSSKGAYKKIAYSLDSQRFVIKHIKDYGLEPVFYETESETEALEIFNNL